MWDWFVPNRGEGFLLVSHRRGFLAQQGYEM